MSTLTKALVVLLSISAIFLCGIVITYVGSADNYKQLYDGQKRNLLSAKQTESKAKDDLNAAKTEFDAKEAELNTQIQSLQSEKMSLDTNLQDSQRDVAKLTGEVSKALNTTQLVYVTVDAQRQQLTDALAEMHALQALKIKQDKEIKETTATLVEKMAMISTLQIQSKQLVAERADLRSKLDQLLRQYGKAAPVNVPVVARPRQVPVASAPRVSANIGLNGRVTAVDTKNSLAEISIGSANGVKEDMKFHVTRGAQFVCDILILDVDADKAVGILDLVHQLPKTGDTVSTNL